MKHDNLPDKIQTFIDAVTELCKQHDAAIESTSDGLVITCDDQGYGGDVYEHINSISAKGLE